METIGITTAADSWFSYVQANDKFYIGSKAEIKRDGKNQKSSTGNSAFNSFPY